MGGQNFLIVQHLDWEAPGQHLLAALQSGGMTYRILEAWHEPVPAVAGFDGLIVLGGSPNVDEEEQFPKKQFSMMSEYLGVFGNFHRIAAVSLLD